MRRTIARYRRPPQHVAKCIGPVSGLTSNYLNLSPSHAKHSGWMTNLNSIHRCGGSVGINSIVAIAPTSRFTPFIEKMSGAPDAGGARLGRSWVAVKQRINYFDQIKDLEG